MGAWRSLKPASGAYHELALACLGLVNNGSVVYAQDNHAKLVDSCGLNFAQILVDDCGLL